MPYLELPIYRNQYAWRAIFDDYKARQTTAKERNTIAPFFVLLYVIVLFLI